MLLAPYADSLPLDQQRLIQQCLCDRQSPALKTMMRTIRQRYAAYLLRTWGEFLPQYQRIWNGFDPVWAAMDLDWDEAIKLSKDLHPFVEALMDKSCFDIRYLNFLYGLKLPIDSAGMAGVDVARY